MIKAVRQKIRYALRFGCKMSGEARVYRRRWLVLGLYVLFCICNAMQWIQFAIISDVIKEFYGISVAAVNATSMVYMISSAVLIFPATWLLNRTGLRMAIILGQTANCLGAIIKIGSASPDRYWVAMLGQTIVACAQVYVMNTPAAFAATWFAPNQVATATGIGFMGLMVGNGLGALLPPLLVTGGEPHEVASQLYTMFYIMAGFATLLLVLIVLLVKDAPPTPPSQAQSERRGERETARHFAGVVWGLVRQANFVRHMLAYGTSVGVFSAIMTYLNPMVLQQFPDGGEAAGYIAVAFIASGLVGTVVCGLILDSSRKFKEMCLALYALTLLGLAAMTTLLALAPITFVYIAAVLIGFVMIGYLPAGYEFGVELTFPQSEATTACLLSFCTFFSSLLFTVVYGLVYQASHSTVANGTMCLALLGGVVLTVLTRPDLRRQRAQLAAGKSPHLPTVLDTKETP